MNTRDKRRRRTGVGMAMMSTAATVTILASSAFHLQLSAALVAVPINHNQCRRLPSSVVTTSNRPAGQGAVTGGGGRNSQNKSPVALNYADEWIDADVELAFHNGSSGNDIDTTANNNINSNNNGGSSSRNRNKRSSSSPFRRLLTRFTRTLYLLKESLRTRLERCTVYVLECESGKYYVGSTTNRKRRYSEHLKRKGSKWTRTHKPLRVLREYRRIPSQFLLGMESKITAEAMLQYGVNNVRGSMFCSPREYHMGDIDSLTKFLGHYNDLNYRKVNLRLSQTLPVNPERKKRWSRYNKIMAGRCYNCGKEGHLAASCPERRGMKQQQEEGVMKNSDLRP